MVVKIVNELPTTKRTHHVTYIDYVFFKSIDRIKLYVGKLHKIFLKTYLKFYNL